MSYDAWSPELWSGESLKTIQVCYHCGDEILKTQRLCPNCHTKEKREELHKVNTEIFAEAGLTYKCKSCEEILNRKKTESILGLKIIPTTSAQ